MIDGSPGQLIDRLLEVAEDPAPQIRAVVTTLLIKSLEDGEGSELIALMVASDGAAAILDREAAADAHAELRQRLRQLLVELARVHGEARLVRIWRGYLLEQMERWAKSAVDDADNRRRAERFLLLADHPSALVAAQRRGFLVGLSPEEVRELARTRSEVPVSPETATDLWSKRDAWRDRTEILLGDDLVEAWESHAER